MSNSHNFAEQVLDYEIALTMSPSVHIIVRLSQLYSVSITKQAIEHYESIGDKRFIMYRQRLENMLADENVQSLLQSRNRQRNPCGIKDQRKVEQILEQQKKQDRNDWVLIQQSLSYQDQAFKEKIKQRHQNRILGDITHKLNIK